MPDRIQRKMPERQSEETIESEVVESDRPATDDLDDLLDEIDEILEEPLGGAHTFPKVTYKKVKKSITKAIKEFIDIDKETLVKNRMKKYSNMGIVKE